jgi:hypothetical protein
MSQPSFMGGVWVSTPQNQVLDTHELLKQSDLHPSAVSWAVLTYVAPRQLSLLSVGPMRHPLPLLFASALGARAGPIPAAPSSRAVPPRRGWPFYVDAAVVVGKSSPCRPAADAAARLDQGPMGAVPPTARACVTFTMISGGTLVSTLQVRKIHPTV